MRKYKFFNFLERKMSNAELDIMITKAVNELSIRELALHIAISYIANTLSKCEFKTFEQGKEEKGKLYYKLNVSPNPNENSSQFINKFIETYFNDGESLVVPIGENIYCADSFTIVENNPLKEFTYENVTFGTYQSKKKYKSSDVFHFKLDNEHTKKLVDLLNTKYSELLGFASESFKRTNGKKYKLILDQTKAGDTTFNEVFENVIKKNLKTFLDNNNSIYPEYKGTKLEEFSTASPTNSNDIIALRKEVFETTAQAFKIPLTMMYGNITNINDVFKVYLTICIDPLADMISEELTRKYYSFDEWKDGNYIKVDTSCITHVDIFEIADKVDKAISSGLCNIDELRPRVNLPPLNTEWSGKHFITKNYELAEKFLDGDQKKE